MFHVTDLYMSSEMKTPLAIKYITLKIALSWVIGNEGRYGEINLKIMHYKAI